MTMRLWLMNLDVDCHQLISSSDSFWGDSACMTHSAGFEVCMCTSESAQK